MVTFIKRIFQFLVAPIILFFILLALYVKVDPYADFGKKENYSWKYFFRALGDLSTKKLINSTTNYNSFIFGSSRTVGLYACYLEKKIPDSKFFHYGNWNESIGGIYNKLRLVDSLGYPIDHAVIYIDTDFTFVDDGQCHSSDHYLLTGENRLSYLCSHFYSYFHNITSDKIKILLGLPVTGDIYPNWTSDIVTNDPRHGCNDPAIIQNYSVKDESDTLAHQIDSLKQIGFLYERPASQQLCKKQISNGEKEILYKIKNLFLKHNTDYYVVITPLYDQKKFDPSDKKILSTIFNDGIFDFSGINEITNDEYNYPDRKHFQPYISKIIVDSILGSNTQSPLTNGAVDVINQPACP